MNSPTPDWGVLWPMGAEAWTQVLLLYLIALFSHNKALALFRQSQERDGLGWSIIGSNKTFGWAFLIGALFTLVPHLRAYRWLQWGAWAGLIVVIVWGTFQIVRSTGQQWRFYVAFMAGHVLAFWGGIVLLAWWLGAV